MKKIVKETNHTKAFITAIGIAFTLLALVVLYVAFSKGGLDIRSKAGLIQEQCYKASKKVLGGKTLYSCPQKTTLKGDQCCTRIIVMPSLPSSRKGLPTMNQRQITPKPTVKLTPMPTKRLIQATPAVIH